MMLDSMLEASITNQEVRRGSQLRKESRTKQHLKSKASTDAEAIVSKTSSSTATWEEAATSRTPAKATETPAGVSREAINSTFNSLQTKLDPNRLN